LQAYHTNQPGTPRAPQIGFIAFVGVGGVYGAIVGGMGAAAGGGHGLLFCDSQKHSQAAFDFEQGISADAAEDGA